MSMEVTVYFSGITRCSELLRVAVKVEFSNERRQCREDEARWHCGFIGDELVRERRRDCEVEK